MVLVLQMVVQSILFFNAWSKDSFTFFVPSLSFAFNGNGSFLTGMYNGFIEVAIGHVLDGEFKQVFIV
jgi:hypothetical protein